MSEKSPSQLIEERVQEMGAMGMYGSEYDDSEYAYTCMDTGLCFETYGEPASYSPFSGSTNISMMESANNEQDSQMASTDIPPSQKDPQTQKPLQANPAPAQPGTGSWVNKPASANPAPDAQSTVGSTQANPTSGFVPYPQQSVPPFVNKQPGERTDK